MKTNLISNVQPTCYSGICKNEQYSGWVLSPEERNVNLEEDKRILLAIKDNEQVFKDLITEQKYESCQLGTREITSSRNNLL